MRGTLLIIILDILFSHIKTKLPRDDILIIEIIDILNLL